MTLTPRQQSVVDAFLRGLTHKQVADELGMTLRGVDYHVRAIRQRTGADTLIQAIGIVCKSTPTQTAPTSV